MPLCIMGHSMGSFLTRSYLIRYPGTVRARRHHGHGLAAAPVIAAGRTLAKLIARREGADATSDLVTKLAFGGYNKAFAPNRTDFDWLSADEGNVDRYIADPMCGADATVGLFLDMLGGISFNQKITNLRKMDHELPVLFVSGDKDPVGQMGKGVQHSFEAFLAAGVKDVSIRLYPGPAPRDSERDRAAGDDLQGHWGLARYKNLKKLGEDTSSPIFYSSFGSLSEGLSSSGLSAD